MTELSAAQRAAITRASNRTNGSTSKAGKASKGEPVFGAARLSGLELTLLVDFTVPGSASVRFLARHAERAAEGDYRTGLGHTERALPDLEWGAILHPTKGEWEVGGACQASFAARSGAYVRDAARLMSEADSALSQARQESDDPTFAFVVAQLAVLFRVTGVTLRTPAGDTEHKRGMAYLATIRACDALAAAPAPANTKPQPLKKAA